MLAWRATMEFRTLGRTDWKISTVSFGAWAIGGTFGTVKDDESMAALHRALDRGVNFFDTADVYGDGRSERLLARLRKERKEPFYITTKAGRRLPKQTVEGYSNEEHRRVRRSQPEEPGGRDHRPAAAPLPADRRVLPPRGVRAVRRPGEGGQDPLLRRQRRAGRGGAEGDRLPGRAVGADRLQHVPPAAGATCSWTRRGGARSACWRGCRCRRGCWRAR